MTIRFRVIDTQTGQEADAEQIALTEDWAQRLVYCDIDGFAITEDGYLVLFDDCGNLAYCPPGRFIPDVEFETMPMETRVPRQPNITWFIPDAEDETMPMETHDGNQ